MERAVGFNSEAIVEQFNLYLSINAGKELMTSETLMEHFKLYLHTDAGKELMNGLVYQINIAPEQIGRNEKSFVVDLNKGEVKEGPFKGGNPDTILSLTEGGFVKVATGKMDPLSAFMRGSLFIKGSSVAAEESIPDIFPMRSKM